METTTTIVLPTVLPLRAKQSTDTYPYGRLRTTAYFSIEFVRNRGFRSVFQTVNPKNGRLNNEKKSTYYHFMYLVQNPENGHYETRVIHCNDLESINKMARYIDTHFEQLDPTEEMIKEICACMFAVSRISASWMKCPEDQLETQKQLLAAPVKAILKGFKEGANVFKDIFFDVAALKALDADKAA